MKGEPFIDFAGKKVIVTGASSGVGRAISIQLSRCGATLILIGRNRESLMETTASLGSGDYHIIVLDLTEHEAILPKIKEISLQVGRIYGLCHAAGMDEIRPLSSCKAERFKPLFDINLIAGIELTRAVCRRDVMEEDGGSILLISSIAAIVGVPGHVAYSASKGAVSAAVRTLAIELAKRKIRVNAIAPGLIRTDMTVKALSVLPEQQRREVEEAHPLGIGNPEDAARAAAFLLAPQNTWITGIDLVIDGGYTAQ